MDGGVVTLAGAGASDGHKSGRRRVVIIGGVAGGMSTATRLRRLDSDVNIVVLERSGFVSFANCGLPYFVGGLIEEGRT
jgi:NADH dehydrogenase FAD-containing subunit